MAVTTSGVPTTPTLRRTRVTAVPSNSGKANQLWAGLLQVWSTFFVPDGVGPAGDTPAEHPTSDAGRPRTVPGPSTEAHHLGGVRPEVWTGPVAFTATVNGVASERVDGEIPSELVLRECDWNAFVLIPERFRPKWCSG